MCAGTHTHTCAHTDAHRFKLTLWALPKRESNTMFASDFCRLLSGVLSHLLLGVSVTHSETEDARPGQVGTVWGGPETPLPLGRVLVQTQEPTDPRSSQPRGPRPVPGGPLHTAGRTQPQLQGHWLGSCAPMSPAPDPPCVCTPLPARACLERARVFPPTPAPLKLSSAPPLVPRPGPRPQGAPRALGSWASAGPRTGELSSGASLSGLFS